VRVRTDNQRVWINSEWECCGEPFEIGSTVRWQVRTPMKQWLAEVLGDEAAPTIDACVELHGSDDGDLIPLQGTVQSIDALLCRYGPSPDYSNALVEIPGSGTLRPRVTAPRSLPDDGDLECIGYLVRVEVVRVTDPGA
jgi:hypothetical protein